MHSATGCGHLGFPLSKPLDALCRGALFRLPPSSPNVVQKQEVQDIRLYHAHHICYIPVTYVYIYIYTYRHLVYIIYYTRFSGLHNLSSSNNRPGRNPLPGRSGQGASNNCAGGAMKSHHFMGIL